MISEVLANELEINNLIDGKGPAAEIGDKVEVHYIGKLTNGESFVSSIEQGQPLAFTLGEGQVIQGWEQGVKGMRVGGKRMLVILPDLAYGAKDAGPAVPPNATLIYEVELLSVSPASVLGQAQNRDLLQALKVGSLVIDIRRKEEWLETGIIKGAHTITAFAEDGGLHQDFHGKFFSLVKSPNTPVLIYCRTGNRTGLLGNALIDQASFTNVTHLTGGILGWKAEGNPLLEYEE